MSCIRESQLRVRARRGKGREKKERKKKESKMELKSDASEGRNIMARKQNNNDEK